MVELNERAPARHSVAAPDSVANALQSGPAVSCRRLSKIFDVIDAGTCWRVVCGLRADPRRVNALQQVTLDVPKGKVVGVMGRNGAGKSTLLRTLAGIYTPTAGEVLVSGEIAGIFELGGGNRFLTGREYAERYLSLRGTDSREQVALIGDIQEFSELGEFFDRRIHTYSTGMAARLYFATATARRHDVYLVDEILSVGDEHFQAKCWARMRDRLQGGASGLLVTHDWPAVMRLCETCYVLDSGRIAAAGPSAKVIPQYLDLSRPATDRARFGRDLPGQVRGASGEDWWLEFAVEALAEVSMEVAFSVERVCAGSEWGILILSRPWPVGRGAGQYRVRIEVPALPLPPGEYQLNLFLSQAAVGPGAAASAVFDVRSWTYGNGIPLQVEGAPRPGLVAMPMRWQADA